MPTCPYPNAPDRDLAEGTSYDRDGDDLTVTVGADGGFGFTAGQLRRGRGDKIIHRLAALLVAASLAPEAAPPVGHPPACAAIVSDRVHCIATESEYATAYVLPLADRSRPRKITLWRTSFDRTEWAVGRDSLWAAVNDWILGVVPGEGEGPETAFVKGHRLRAVFDLAGVIEDDEKNRILADHESPARIAYHLHGGYNYPTSIHPSLAVTPSGKATQFVPTNVRGAATAGGEGGVLGAMRLDHTGDERNRSVWSMSSHVIPDTPAGKDGKRPHGRWVKSETFDVAFREPFRAFSVGEDFYFHTEFGRLFRAPKPEKGTHRKVIDLKVARSVEAVIGDVDGGRVFFFVKPATPGGRRSFAEVGPALKFVEYEPADAAYKKAGSPLDDVMPFVRVQVNRGVVKVPPAK